MVGAKYPQEDAMSTDKIDNDTPFGTSHGPFLTGEFAPNTEELELTELPVEGKIPDDLNGDPCWSFSQWSIHVSQ